MADRQYGTILRALTAAALLVVLDVSCSHAADKGYAQLVRNAAPSVVTVLVELKPEGAGQRAVERATADAGSGAVRDILRGLLAQPGSTPALRREVFSQGSGFVIRADGLIVTNRHVVLGARSVRVKLANGRELPARIIGVDAPTDIALLKVRSDPLPPLRLGSSADVSIGDLLVVIGNPLGLGQSVTAGVLSARGRTLEQDPYIDFLQTDAAINFGNSGGPLLSQDGTVVGVASAILSSSGGSMGLGFAIPAETVAQVTRELETTGRVKRGYLGVFAQSLTPAVARSLGLDRPSGALITELEPHGPAAGALQIGDVLLSINSQPVSYERLGRVAARLRPGTTAQVLVMRDGVQQTLGLVVGQLPDPPIDPALTGDADTWVPSLELGVAPATAAIRSALKVRDETGGLIITQLRPEGAGALAGLRIGDLITYAGSQHLERVSDLAAVRKPSVRLPLLLRVVRDGSPAFIAVTGTQEN